MAASIHVDPVGRSERLIRSFWTALVLGWLLLAAFQPHLPVNPASRFATIEAVVDFGSWTIDDASLRRATIDKVFWEDHWYSSKPPLMPLLGVPFYALWRAFDMPSFADDQYLAASFMRLPMSILPWLLLVGLWTRLLDRTIPDATARLAMHAALVLGSLATAFGADLDNHTASAVGVVGMLLGLAPMITCKGSPLAPEDLPISAAAGAGLAGGLAAAFDLGAIPLVGMLGAAAVFVLWRSGNRRAALALAAAGLAAPLAQTLLQWALVGTWKPFYLLKGAYSYPGSYWKNPTEFDALAEPRLVYAFHAILGHHGIVSVSPYLLPGLLAWGSLAWRRDHPGWLRVAALVGVAFPLVYYILKTENYGGRSAGMRWWLVLHPMLAWLGAAWLSRTGISRRWPWLVGILVGWSALVALPSVLNAWEEGVIHVIFRALGAGSVDG